MSNMRDRIVPFYIIPISLFETHLSTLADPLRLNDVLKPKDKIEMNLAFVNKRRVFYKM